MNPKCLSHRNDPETSKEAAEKMVESGKLSRQEQDVFYEARLFLLIALKGGKGFTDFTARELSDWHNGSLDYYTIQRRLSGLHRKGKIERTGEKRNGYSVWRVKCEK